MNPLDVILPIFPPADSVNHIRPSGPFTMAHGLLSLVGGVNSWTLPSMVVRPIFDRPHSVNHNEPPDPTAIPHRSEPADNEKFCHFDPSPRWITCGCARSLLSEPAEIAPVRSAQLVA